MPRWLQILLQIVATAGGAYGAYATGTPLPLVVSGGVNTVIGGIAQSYNTDGTPQAVAYVPKSNVVPPPASPDVVMK